MKPLGWRLLSREPRSVGPAGPTRTPSRAFRRTPLVRVSGNPSRNPAPRRNLLGFLAPGRRRAGGVAFTLATALVAGGCRGGLTPPVNLQVAISTGVGNDEVVRRSLDRLASQIAEIGRAHV